MKKLALGILSAVALTFGGFLSGAASADSFPLETTCYAQSFDYTVDTGSFFGMAHVTPQDPGLAQRGLVLRLDAFQVLYPDGVEETVQFGSRRAEVVASAGIVAEIPTCGEITHYTVTYASGMQETIKVGSVREAQLMEIGWIE